MQVKSFRISGVELVSVSPIKKNISKSTGTWDCQPIFEIGLNSDNVYVQNITLTLIRKKDYKEVIMVVKTSFHLDLGSDDVKPTTKEDFDFYVLICQMAHAHMRAFFIAKMVGTPFEGQLLPQDSNDSMLAKIKFGLSMQNRAN